MQLVRLRHLERGINEQYKVEITKEALQDMEDIYNYIAIDLLAPDNAMGQYNRIADEILTLDTFPERFRIMDSEPEKRMELRRMLVDNYSEILYNSYWGGMSNWISLQECRMQWRENLTL